MTTPKYHQIKNKENNTISKAQLHTLMSELERSRMAVENIIAFASGEGKFKQKIGNLQDELQVCISSISTESKKYKVLNELITLLKGQVLKFQSTKKKQVEEEEMKCEKQIVKYQYEIDQILQKHNEQIAKIHNLKELANSRRSERVVYSNLFKKLQKEIKHYEQIYKKQLIVSESVCFKISKIGEAQQKIKDSAETEQKKKMAEQITKINFSKRNTLTEGNSVIAPASAPINVFITENKQCEYKIPRSTHYPKKIYQFGQNHQKATGWKQQKIAHTQDLLDQISMYTNLTDKIKVHSECFSISQVIEHYSQLQQQNNSLELKIRQFDTIIEDIIEDSEKLSKKMAEEEIAKKLTIVPISPHHNTHFTKIRNSSILMTKPIEQQQQQISHLKTQLLQIGNLFGIQSKSGIKQTLNYDFLQFLDNKIAILSQETANNRNELNRRQDTLLSETIVDCLLEKMEKYHSCQRILDQNLFRQEYYKQLTKRRPYRSKKDTAK